MTSSVGRVALYNMYPVGSSGVVSLIVRAGCFRNVPCMCYVASPVVTES